MFMFDMHDGMHRDVFPRSFVDFYAVPAEVCYFWRFRLSLNLWLFHGWWPNSAFEWSLCRSWL